ncbi:MAG: 50S ribosomal protein L30 [Candidatus Aenigmatarchaeota archaeon]
MLAVIKVRSSIGASRKIRDTLKLLKLEKVNSCTLVDNSTSFLGMLNVVKDFVTYGEIDKETLIELLSKRLRTKDNKVVDEKLLKEITGYENFEKFSEALLKKEANLKEFKKVFPLKPPKGGYKSIKEAYPKGDLGYRGIEINKLIKRML